MIFTPLLSAALCASSALAQATQYQLVGDIADGNPEDERQSAIGYNSNSGALAMYADTPFEAVFSNGQLQVAGSSQSVVVQSNGQLTVTNGSTQGQDGFDLVNYHLTYNDEIGFYVCPSQGYTLYFNLDNPACSDYVALEVWGDGPGDV